MREDDTVTFSAPKGDDWGTITKRFGKWRGRGEAIIGPKDTLELDVEYEDNGWYQGL